MLLLLVGQPLVVISVMPFALLGSVSHLRVREIIDVGVEPPTSNKVICLLLEVLVLLVEWICVRV